MQIAPTKFLLKDGTPVILRSPEPGDAVSMLTYLKKTSGETPFMIRYPEEVTDTEEEEVKFIDHVLTSPRDFMISAALNGEIIGNVAVYAVADRQKMRHRASIGIAVLKKYWELGLGRELMTAAMEQAKKNGFQQIELGVFENNIVARSLYAQLDFQETGRIPRAFRLKNESYIDEISMICYL